MDHRTTTLEADKIHQNRLSNVTDDDEEQDAAFTIVRVLDKVATIVDSVQASQKRIEERHREMEDAIKTIQIDLLKLAQAHGSTAYTVNKLLEKTRKVNARVKEVRARVEKQSANVRKVEAKQEEMLRKNKFRVVIYQENIKCPSSVSVINDQTQGEDLEDAFCPPDDLSSDEEYYMEESKASRFKKSGIRRINNIKKAFSRENLQKTRQNFGNKVDRLRTRIVTPERRERIRQSGERLRQTGIRFKKNISNAAPTKETFKKHKKTKEQAATESPEEIQESAVDTADTAVESGDTEPVSEEISYTEVITKVKKNKSNGSKGPQVENKIVLTPDKIVLKPEVKVMTPETVMLKPEVKVTPGKITLKPQAKEEEDVLLLDLKQSI
ncbi:caveolae-associated protein 4 [Anolis carolinensis]|uniref:Muscle-restricted coiled-coil protein n=1 Tax=Anolis carolinensis TaxID=28377 RepID=A0A803T1S5_ANOCA|nr:PREDICTED: muscle-related coiled-coil protein [Anolis carolinensis]|eukprot:XP_003219877.1 PREDICTED: muscle-related coiled-coil protein [Anolis carolinensis]